MDNFVVCHRHTGCVETSELWGLMERLLRGMHFEYFKVFKEEAGGFPSLAQGKEIDSGIVA